MNDRLQSVADLASAGDYAGARVLCRSILDEFPDDVGVLHWLGNIEAQSGALAAATECLSRAATLDPERPGLWRDIGVIQLAARRPTEAVAALRKATALRPVCADTQRLLARELLAGGTVQEALMIFAGLAEADPDNVQNLAGLSQALVAAGQVEPALAVIRRHLELDPDAIQAHVLAASVCGRLARNGEQFHHAQRALQLQPAALSAQWAYAVACFDTGDLQQSLDWFRRILPTKNLTGQSHSCYLTVLLHTEADDPELLLSEHTSWARRYAPPQAGRRQYPNVPDPERPLRIGYVTGELVRCPSQYFLLPILREHDRSRFDIVCYHTRPLSDAVTKECEALASEWRGQAGLSDSQLEAQILRDNIDILIDLSGHYPHHGLTVFSRRPAPVQVAYPNYPSTTGLAAFDALITDEWTTPRGSEQFYAEPVIRLKSGYLAYSPPVEAPEPSDQPAIRNGWVTFGIFQRPSKYNKGFWNAVAAILAGTTDSRLVVHFRSSDLAQPESVTSRRILTELAARGICGHRVTLRPGTEMSEHLRVISDCDIALDTFPYNGQTTTCESLWMGVPVVTLSGRSHVSRVTGALLNRLGLTDWIAGSADEFIRIAVNSAHDPRALQEFRSMIRTKLLRSTVCSGELVTRDFEAALRGLWRNWCAQASATQ